MHLGKEQVYTLFRLFDTNDNYTLKKSISQFLGISENVFQDYVAMLGTAYGEYTLGDVVATNDSNGKIDLSIVLEGDPLTHQDGFFTTLDFMHINEYHKTMSSGLYWNI